MKKELNWSKLRRDSENKEVSVYILAKRELNYRKVSYKDFGRNCFNCRASDIISYKDCNRTQCAWIGIIKDSNADIDSDHICNFHEYVHEKNLRKKEVQNATDI